MHRLIPKLNIPILLICHRQNC